MINRRLTMSPPEYRHGFGISDVARSPLKLSLGACRGNTQAGVSDFLSVTRTRDGLFTEHALVVRASQLTLVSSLRRKPIASGFGTSPNGRSAPSVSNSLIYVRLRSPAVLIRAMAAWAPSNLDAIID